MQLQAVSDVLAAFVFLFSFFFSTVVDAFSEDVISLNILKRLINQPHVIQEIKLQDEDDINQKYLYKKGAVGEFFTLIIQGKVEVTIGQEELTFEEGPFAFFGAKALVSSLSMSNPNVRAVGQYIPDYSVRVVTDVMYLKIPKGMYKQAVRATLMERQQGTDGSDGMLLQMRHINFQDIGGMNHVGVPEVQPNHLYLETTC